jgi:hypothetical protein
MQLILLIVSLIAFINAGSMCGNNGIGCPDGFKCVPHTGCVPSDPSCKCPDEACKWPLQCDCRGGCKQRICNPFVGCSNKTNPTNACEVLACQSGKCTVVKRDCKNCDPVTGCSITLNAKSIQTVSDEPTAAPTGSSGGVHGLVIGMIVVIALSTLFLVAVMIYAATTARMSK